MVLFISEKQETICMNLYDLSLTLKIFLLESPQGSVLGPLLFLIYINDLHNCVKYSKTYHFADDNNILYSNKSLEVLVKNINHDSKTLSGWLKANKLCLNVKKLYQ